MIDHLSDLRVLTISPSLHLTRGMPFFPVPAPSPLRPALKHPYLLPVCSLPPFLHLDHRGSHPHPYTQSPHRRHLPDTPLPSPPHVRFVIWCPLQLAILVQALLPQNKAWSHIQQNRYQPLQHWSVAARALERQQNQSEC